tara:strand:+ start:1082 stop:1300 length:219 start_codon:yes stop_codon:yes gene_type:complete
MKKELAIKELDKLFHNKWKSYKNNKLLKDTEGWDSFKQIQLVILIEKKIKKKLSVQKILKIKKVSDINLYLK